MTWMIFRSESGGLLSSSCVEKIATIFTDTTGETNKKSKGFDEDG